MAKKNKGPGEDKDNGIVIAGLVLLVFILLGPLWMEAVWAKVGVIFTFIFAHLRKAEMVVFAGIFEGAAYLDKYLDAVLAARRSLSLDGYTAMMSRTGDYVRWLFIPPMLLTAAWVFVRSPRERFSNRHTMSSLAKSQVGVWPEIAPVAAMQDDLVDADPTKGEWASAMTEREFAARHKLVSKDGPLDRAGARAVFSKQLKARWPGADRLPKHQRALFAVFCLRLAGKQDEALVAIRKLASSFQAKGINGLDVSWVDKAIEAHGQHPLVLKAIKRHAYTYTVLATMLQVARADGVLASALFVWLKPTDRELWYMLNNVGRYAFHAECAGIAAHWLFEKTLGAAVTTPMVEKAVDGLEMALREYRDDDRLERIYH